MSARPSNILINAGVAFPDCSVPEGGDGPRGTRARDRRGSWGAVAEAWGRADDTALTKFLCDARSLSRRCLSYHSPCTVPLIYDLLSFRARVCDDRTRYYEGSFFTS